MGYSIKNLKEIYYIINTRVRLKKAFTMIELIFALVIIGFAASSFLLIINTTNIGMEKNIVQEVVFAGSAKLNQAINQIGNKSLENIQVSQQDLFSDTSLGQEGYKKAYLFSIVVSPNAVFNSNTDVNMKKIIVNIFNKEDGLLVSSLFSYNIDISEVTYQKKRF